MNEKGQEKEGFGATVLRALSLIYKYTYLCVHVDIPDPQTHLLLCSLSAAQLQSGAWTEVTARGVIAPLGCG